MKKLVIIAAVLLVAVLLFLGGKKVLTISNADNAVDSTTVVVDSVSVDSAAVISPDSTK